MFNPDVYIDDFIKSTKAFSFCVHCHQILPLNKSLFLVASKHPKRSKNWESRPCPWAPQVEGSVQEKAGLIIAVQACELLGPKKESSRNRFLLGRWRAAARFGVAYVWGKYGKITFRHFELLFHCGQ